MIGNHVYGYCLYQGFESLTLRCCKWPVGQVVKTPPFHGGNMGSNPVRVIGFKVLTMENYPSLAEGNGLENRQVGQTTREFESLILLSIIAGWSSLVARRAHNPKVVGSNPAPAIMVLWSSWLGRLPVTHEITSSSLVRTVNGSVAQSVEQWIEAPCVGGSIPSRAISVFCGYSLVVKPQPSKLLSRVRFSLPAFFGPIAQLV